MDAALTDALITQIYSAGAGRQPWDAALNTISDACDAWAVQLMAIDKRSGTALFSHYGGVASPESHLTYLRDYQRNDPRAPLVFAPIGQDWTHCHEAFSDEQVAGSPFYQDFLIPVGARYASIVKLVNDDAMGIVLGILRGVGKPPLEASFITWIDRLRQHFSEALAIYRHLSTLHLERAAGKEILDRLRHPVMLVDAAGMLRHANAAARDALSSGQAVRVVNDKLQCSNRSDDEALAQALDALVIAAPSSRGNERRFVRLRGTGAHQRYGISLSALRPAETLGAFGPLPLAMLVLHDGTQTAQCDPFVIQELFDLTPAEADVGTLLSLGSSLEEIAGLRHVALSTVRSQLRTLMAKTGTERQSDLVRRLLTLPHGLSG